MKNPIAHIANIVLIVGCITLSLSLLVAAILPHVFQVYLATHPSSYSHEILYPNMTSLYILSVIEIGAGIGGLLSAGNKNKEEKN